jgi:hypothetical protein
MYSPYGRWVFVKPRLAGSKESDELSIDLPWDEEAAVILDPAASAANPQAVAVAAQLG